MSIIKLKDVSVKFHVYGIADRSLKKKFVAASVGGRLESSGKRGTKVVDALKNITLDVNKGDRIGLIGGNGAGKSTLLRVIAGIYKPYIGEVSVRGKISPLFDINLGMDLEATGYENILIRGLLMGYSKSDMRCKMDEIADFSGLGEYLSMPTRTYSDGMRLRLTFSVSTAFFPDILLMDEGILAGDSSFIEKANQRLDGFVGASNVFVMASHSKEILAKFCNKIVHMEAGSIYKVGDAKSILEQYN